MIDERDLAMVTDIAAAAMTSSWHDYESGLVASEDRLTEAVATRMRDSVARILVPSGNNFAIRAFQSSAGRYGVSEETKLGADLLAVLTIATDQQRLCLGWIAQAKIRRKLRRGSWLSLQKQCKQMESELPGLGYAVIYAGRTKVLRANQIAGLVDPADGALLPSQTWRSHFLRFFQGEFGDRRACQLLATEFVQRRRRESQRGTVVLDLFYGEIEQFDEWNASHVGQLEDLPRNVRGLNDRGD